MARRLPRTALQRQHIARQLTPGTGGGRSALIAPVPVPPHTVTTATRVLEATSWSSDGDIVVSDVSDTYEVLVGGNRVTLIANLTATLTGDTDIDLLLNGVSVGTVTVESGETRGEVVLAEPTVAGDLLTLESTAVGTGSARSTVQLKIES